MCNDATVIIEPIVDNVTVVMEFECSQVTITTSQLGSQGLSAYQIAVINGFVGTEEEWLDSLKAKNYIRRHDFVSNASYCGFAEEGALETANVWNISKIEVSTDGTTIVRGALAVDWTNHLTHTYT